MFKRKNEYLEASKRMNDSSSNKLASKRIIFEVLEDDDERAALLVEELVSGNPLVLNFEKLDLMGANKMLAFFSGAVYAIEGETVKIKPSVFLFARKVDFLDGSLKEFLDNTKK